MPQGSQPAIPAGEGARRGPPPASPSSRGAARTPQSRLHGRRSRTNLYRRLPPPAQPGSCPSLSSLHPPPERTREPPPRSTRGGSGRGVVSREKLRTAARSSGTKLQGAEAREVHSPRKVWSRPRRVPSSPHAHSLGAAWPAALVYFRGYTARPRRSSEADPPREGVPATLTAPAPPSGAPPAQPARRPRSSAPSRRGAELESSSWAPREAGESWDHAPGIPSP